MRKMSDTIKRISLLQQKASAASALPPSDRDPRLARLEGFGANPGALKGWTYLPAGLKPGAALVVVLHGCTQNAAGYDRGSGWSELAERHGFALLFPEQTRTNNMNLCFNWYDPGHTRRGRGEASSIAEMVRAMISRHAIDPARVFVTGLSAGGAMTAVMLATYPELFAGGAIIAGVAYGSASNVPQAFDRMRGHGGPGATELAEMVRSAAPRAEAWPTVAIWHGTADSTVDVSNAGFILDQWRGVHGLGDTPDRTGEVDGYPYRAWTDATGRTVVEDYLITGMGHGTPLDTRGHDAVGRSGDHMLDVAISSTAHIARSWGLTASEPDQAPQPAQADDRQVATLDNKRLVKEKAAPAANDGQPTAAAAGGVQEVIENALRAAGLMR